MSKSYEELKKEMNEPKNYQEIQQELWEETHPEALQDSIIELGHELEEKMTFAPDTGEIVPISDLNEPSHKDICDCPQECECFGGKQNCHNHDK